MLFSTDLISKYIQYCVRADTISYILHIKVLRSDLWANEEDILCSTLFSVYNIKMLWRLQRKRLVHILIWLNKKLIYFAWH